MNERSTVLVDKELLNELSVAIQDFALRPQDWRTYGTLPSGEALATFMWTFLTMRKEMEAKKIAAMFDDAQNRLKNGKE